MIGTQRLHQLATLATLNGWRGKCRGELVLAAQKELYGSGASSLTPQELQEVISYLKGSARPRSLRKIRVAAS